MGGPFLRPHRPVAALLAAILCIPVTAIAPALLQATSSDSPYTVPQVTDTNPDPNIVETTIVADEDTVDLGNGLTADVMAFNGTIPGPEFRLTVGQRVIVHFENNLNTEETGIHWHGIELANASDGTPLTQNQVPPGESYLYDFVVSRPGVYWYHPHHHHSTNHVFRGLYGPIVITDPNEAELIADGTIPSAADTHTLALSDVTVCKEPGSNDAATYDPTLPWAGGGPLPAQQAPFPTTLCDTPIDDLGAPIGAPLTAGKVPNIQRSAGRVNEGQTVLTNGMNVGGRAGDPAAPGALAGGAFTLDVNPGQGIRLQIGNAATTRFFRLRMTANDGTFIPLVRVGGEGGLLDDAVLDGTVAAGFEFKYPSGEIVLDPGDRADVVAAIPAGATGVATLWTQDFQRAGGGDGAGGWLRLPTVPVAHFNVTGAAVVPAFTIGSGTALRSATGDPQEVLPAATGDLLDPTTFVPAKIGWSTPDIDAIELNALGSGSSTFINGLQGHHDFPGLDYTAIPHEDSGRYAVLGDVLELTVENTTAAHHPFHMHGFSIQPISYTGCPGAVTSFTFPEPEFMDNLDVPPGCTLTYRTHLEDRPLVDGLTAGGGLGRWVFHCHIFFHAVFGMISEITVVADDTGNEKPFVDADEPSVTVAEGDTATMTGTFVDPDGDAVTLTASVGTVIDEGGGVWSWEYTPPDGPLVEMVFITATDSEGNAGQTAFALETENVPPTVTIDPAQVTAIDEGDTLSVAATFTDPGDDDPYTATIDYGDGSGPQVVTAVVTNSTPPQTGTVAGSFQYGDNGIYHVTVTVTDKDGAPGSAAFDVTVSNVDPAMDDIATIIADVGDVVPFSTRVVDPGSDDLTVTWAWDDGTPDTVQVSLVNPPGTDPPMSPSVQPRDEIFATSHVFTEACLYDVSFSVVDDDGGSDAETVAVIITNPPSKSRSSGFWQTAYKGTGGSDFSQAELQCFLDIAGFLSTTFNEVRDASTIPLAYDVLWLGGNAGSERQKLDRELLTAWLNFANGSIEYDQLFVTVKNSPPQTFAAAMATAEAVRNNPASTDKQLQDQRNIVQHLN